MIILEIVSSPSAQAVVLFMVREIAWKIICKWIDTEYNNNRFWCFDWNAEYEPDLLTQPRMNYK